MDKKEREICKLRNQLQESGRQREKLEKKIEENASEISKKNEDMEEIKEEMEKIKKVNETLLKNSELGPKDNIKKNETPMCDENKTSKIFNANPLPGGKSKFKN